VKPYLEKLFTKIGLVEWLKVKALSSSPSTTKKKRERETVDFFVGGIGDRIQGFTQASGCFTTQL
jgi:hypothetical protein